MTRNCGVPILMMLVLVGTVACGGRSAPEKAAPLQVAGDIAARRAGFAPTRLQATTSHLSAGDVQALAHLVKAARVIDRVFSRQAWVGNAELAPRVEVLDGPGAIATRAYFRIMAGPWDRVKEFEPFIGTAPHPPGAGFYPEDMTKAEFEAHLAAHPADRAAFTSTFTVIRRQNGKLVAVPYSVEYKDLLAEVATELRAAAAATGNASLKKFLTLRADAFSSDDYFASDVAWMDLDSPIEVAIGPYETYEDGLFGAKAAFEAFVCVAQPEDSERLARFKQELPFLESRLPMPAAYRNTKRGGESPIRVVDEVITAGDARRGVQTLAFNLPNDERVREAKGSKKVLLKNMMHAKFNAILTPIAKQALAPEDAAAVDFDAYFNFVLFHEMSHGLGPGRIKVAGRDTEVRKELKELYSAIEEAKADVLGVFDLAVLANKGVVDVGIVKVLPVTYLAGLFRTARFGATEAHGLGVVIQTNWMIEHKAIEVASDGTFSPVLAHFGGAVKSLATELLTIEAEGDYARAQRLVGKYGTLSPAMAATISKLDKIPVDIDPEFEADTWR